MIDITSLVDSFQGNYNDVHIEKCIRLFERLNKYNAAEICWLQKNGIQNRM